MTVLYATITAIGAEGWSEPRLLATAAVLN
jgi:hypothetical protein